MIVSSLNPPTRGGLSRVTKFLAHHKVSRVEFNHFQPDSHGLAHFDMSNYNNFRNVK